MEERVQLCEEFMNTSERMISWQSIKGIEMACLVQSTTVCWLASDSLSPCYICQEVMTYEKQRGSNDSTYWVLFELIWRDYFGFLFSKIWELHFLARVTIASTLLYAWNWELWNSAMRYWTSRYRDTYHWWSAANTRNVRYIHTLSWSMVNPPLAYHKLLVNYQIKRKC